MVKKMRHRGLIKRSSHYLIKPTVPNHGPLHIGQLVEDNFGLLIDRSPRAQRELVRLDH